jgi:hypothetical protein
MAHSLPIKAEDSITDLKTYMACRGLLRIGMGSSLTPMCIRQETEPGRAGESALSLLEREEDDGCGSDGF